MKYLSRLVILFALSFTFGPAVVQAQNPPSTKQKTVARKQIKPARGPSVVRKTGKASMARRPSGAVTQRAPKPQPPVAGSEQALFERALQLQRAGRRTEAIEAYKQLLRVTPGSYAANMNLAMLYEEVSDPLLAASFYRKAHQVDPGNAQPLAQLATLYARTGRMADALAEAQRAVALDPKNAQAPFVLGTVYASSQNWPAAESAFRLAVRLAPGFGRAHLALANALASQNRVEEAISTVENAVKVDPTNAEGFTYLGTLKFMAGQAEGAVNAYRRAAELQPKVAANHFNLGIAYDRLADQSKDKRLIEKAIAAYSEALKIAPNNAQARANLARGYYNLGQYPKSAANFELAAKGRVSASILADTGLAFAMSAGETKDPEARAKNLKQAETHYRRAIVLRDAPPSAFNGLAYVYDLMGSASQAADTFAKMAARYPKDPEPWLNLGKLREIQKRPAEAESAYKRAVQADSGNEQTRYALAGFYDKNRRFAEAADIYLKLIAKDQENDEPRRLLGQLYLKQGKKKEAIEHFEIVRRLKPKDRGALIALGTTYEQIGDYEAALREYRQLALLNPDDLTARWYSARVLELAKRYEEAIVEYREAERLNPKDNFHGLHVARLLAELGKNEDAAVEYLRLVQKNPDDVNTRAQLGDFLEKRGKLDEAAQQFQAIVTANPKATPSWLRLGSLYEKQNKKEEARGAYLKAVEDPVGGQQAYAKLKQLYEQENRPEAWISFLQARLTENPSNTMALTQLEETAAKAGKQGEMLAFLSNLASSKGGSDRAFLLGYASIANRHGKVDDSIAAYRKVAALSPNDYTTRALLGLLLESLKRLPESIAVYEEIVKIGGVPKPDMSLYRMNLAHLYEKAGQSAKAVTQYREALKLDPQNTNAQDNLRRLGG